MKVTLSVLSSQREEAVSFSLCARGRGGVQVPPTLSD